MQRYCSGCGKEVQADWTSCPYCSNSLSPTVAQSNLQIRPVKQKLSIKLVKKSYFPKPKLTVIFSDPLNGLKEKITFSTFARTYTAKLANGTRIGKLPLQGITIFSGAEGMISFPSGHSYNVKLMTNGFGPRGLTITDWDDGRKTMTTF